MKSLKLMHMKSFLIFDLPLDNGYIGPAFVATHNKLTATHVEWSIQATRLKLLANYWFKYVFTHFCTIYGLATAVTFLLSSHFNLVFLAAGLTAGIVSFIVLTITYYAPCYFLNFLPKLHSITAEFETREKARLQKETQKHLQQQFSDEYEKLAHEREELIRQRERLEMLQKEMVKCRKEQLHTFSLVLIFYVFDEISGLKVLQCNDRTALLLTKLLGKAPRGIKDNLQLILGKKRELSPRNRTEIQNRFNDVYAFFEELQFPEGIQFLRRLESKFIQ